jgi:hypothetical protein
MVGDVLMRHGRRCPYEWRLMRVYRAKHGCVHAADGRLCLLEHHLPRRRESRESDTQELTGLGISYLERLPDDEC